MPELPEVENIRIQLDKFLVGHSIERVQINYKKCFTGNPINIEGGKILKARRFGKALSLDLNNGYSLVIHIKMTGQLIYRGPNLKEPKKLSEKIKDGLGGKHTHVIFYLNRKGVLYYNDVRKFGWINVKKSEKLNDISFIESLGPEPEVNPSNPPLNPLTLEKFKMILGSTGRSIKVVLMDQSKIAGVGNIYANDALWLAKIHPERKSNKLSNEQVNKLYRSIIKVLKDGLKYHGASENSYVTPDGMEGMYQQHFLIYGKEGKLCKRCKTGKFKKSKVGGRGTYYCPNCQKK